MYKNEIEQACREYNIPVEVVKVIDAPQMWSHSVIPICRTTAKGKKGRKVRVTWVKNHAPDIQASINEQLAKAKRPLINGVAVRQNGGLYIDIPKHDTERRSISATSLRPSISGMRLPIVVGVDVEGKPVAFDLADSNSPHLLVAGTTGSGKSVGVVNAICSLATSGNTRSVRFYGIDLKRTELTPFRRSAYFESVATDVLSATQMLVNLAQHMDSRYAAMAKRGVSDSRALGYIDIVLVIDELADLIMLGGSEVTESLIRLGQMGRAAGIHIVAATQRPSVNVVAGLIRANFPARLAFRVVDAGNSRIILDVGGAEDLTGKGDFILSVGGELIRGQGAYVPKDDLPRLLQFKKQQVQAKPQPVQRPQTRNSPMFLLGKLAYLLVVGAVPVGLCLILIAVLISTLA